MEKKEKRPLYDDTIEFDIEKLPTVLKEEIVKMEEYSERGDEFNYDIVFDMFEVDARSYLRTKRITLEEYKILTRKYGWLYD